MYVTIRKKGLAILLTMAMVFSLMPITTVEASVNTAGKEVVFIENNVSEYQLLADCADPGTETYILDSNQCGLEQMADILNKKSGIDVIHVITHGSKGHRIHQPSNNAAGNQRGSDSKSDRSKSRTDKQ